MIDLVDDDGETSEKDIGDSFNNNKKGSVKCNDSNEKQPPNDTIDVEKDLEIHQLLGEALEMCVHQILYVRGVYPRETFAPTRYLGVRCHGCRVPAVTDYVVNALQVALPALVDGTVSEISVIVFDADSGSIMVHSQSQTGDDLLAESSQNFRRTPVSAQSERVIERYNFDFGGYMSDDGNGIANSPQNISKKRSELEWGFRGMLMRLKTLEGARACGPTLPPTACFRIGVKSKIMIPSITSTLAPSTVTTALREGKWFQADPPFPQERDDEKDYHANKNVDPLSKKRRLLTRPLKNIQMPTCGLRIILSLDLQE